jgi:hypothetical protein
MTTSQKPSAGETVQHTKGPWEIRGRGHNRADIWQAEHAGNEQIGEVYTGGANKNNSGHANARLIAAAPDLLAFVRHVEAEALEIANAHRSHRAGALHNAARELLKDLSVS